MFSNAAPIESKLIFSHLIVLKGRADADVPWRLLWATLGSLATVYGFDHCYLRRKRLGRLKSKPLYAAGSEQVQLGSWPSSAPCKFHQAHGSGGQLVP